MERTMLTFGGRGTSTQVLLSMRALYSSHIACFQLGSRRAWNGDLGIGEEVVTWKLYLGLAFTVPTLERVTIGCFEVVGGGGGGGGGGGVTGGVGVVCGDGVDSGVGAEGKDSFVKCDMTRNDDFVGVQVKAPVSTMIVSVPEKDRWCGTRGKFVRWKGVRVTKASKCANVGAPTPQIQGVSKTDFENYVKANDAVLKNVQNQGQNLQNQMANVTSLLTSLCNNFKNSASTSNSGTLPSQTVTNPRQQINAITTRSGKTLEEPSTPLVPTPVISIPQNPKTSIEKVQNLNLENTAHVLPPGEEDSIFIQIPKPKAKKTVNLDPNSPNPNSYQSRIPYPERMKVRENDKPSAQHSR
ncbi:hypothetical protein Tco_0212057, partial [Tanacetum coccineum]